MWTEELDCTFTQLNIAAGFIFVFLAVGCLTLQPTAMKIGRRPVYLAGTIIAMVSCVIGSQAKSIGSLYAFSVLSGFAAAPVDSLVEISAADVFFLHERSTAFSSLILALYAGSDLGPVAAGYIVERYDWRWTFYIQIIIYGVLFVVQFFVMEDTTFTRRESDNKLESEILEQIISREVEIETSNNKANAVTDIKETSQSMSDADSIDHSIPKRTYIQKLKPFESEYNDTRSWFTIFLGPFYLITFPALLWGGLVYGAQMMWLSLLATTQSEFYSLEPYSFTAPQVGLTNIGAFIGSVLGMFYGGRFVDYLTVRLAERNNGILEPEFRLYAMIIPTILNAAGVLAYGLGLHYGASWEVSVVLGQGFLGFAMSSSGAICLTYAVDSYHNLASEGIVLMLVIRNLIGTVFTFTIQPWLDADGVKLTTWILFMLAVIINGSFLLMIKYGKACRRWTAAKYERLSAK